MRVARADGSSEHDFGSTLVLEADFAARVAVVSRPVTVIVSEQQHVALRKNAVSYAVPQQSVAAEKVAV